MSNEHLSPRSWYADYESPVTNWMKLDNLEGGIFRLRINAVQFPLELPEANGKLLLVMGDIDIPIGMAIAAKYANRFGAIAFQRKEQYIIVVSRYPRYAVGTEKSFMEIMGA